MPERLEFIIQAKDQFSWAFRKLTGYLPSMKTVAVAAAGGIAALGAATIALTKQTAEAHDKIQKLSDQLEVTTQFLSRMEVAANFSGIAIETTNNAVKKLQIGLGEAAKGTGTARQALDDLNVSIYTASGRLKTAEEIMPELADGLHKVADASARAELASKLFGIRGVEMLQLFGDGAAGFRKMSDEADRFGVTVSARAGANAAAFNDALYRVQLSLQGLRNYIAEKAMPIITGLANRFAYFVADNRGEIVDFAEVFIGAVGKVAQYSAYAVALMIDSWRGLQEIWLLLKIGFAEFIAFMLDGLAQMSESLDSGFVNTLLRAAALTNPALAGITEGLIQMREHTALTGEHFQQMAETARESLMGLVNEGLAVEKVDNFVDAVKNAIAEIRAEGESGPTTEDIVGVSDAATERTVTNIQTMTEAQKAAYEALLEAHDEYYLSEEERLEEWYEVQAELYGEHKEAIAILDEVYLARALDIDNKKRAEKAKQDKAADALKIKQADEREKSLHQIQKVFGIKGFNLAKAFNIKETTMATYNAAVNAYKSLSGIPYVGPVLGAIAAAAAIAFGLGQVADIQGLSVGGAAHGGLENVPKEQTYLLDKGERVLSPRQNEDLTGFINGAQGGGSVTIQNLTVEVLPNATNPEALLSMTKQDWREIVEDKIFPAFTQLGTAGISA